MFDISGDIYPYIDFFYQSQMQLTESLPVVDKNSILECFTHLYSSHSTPSTRNQANQFLLDFQKNPIDLLANLIIIFEQSLQKEPLLAFRALVYFCNVLKRNWVLRRTGKLHSDFELAKKQIRQKILYFLSNTAHCYMPTLFDVLKFILKVDYPHAYPSFTGFAQQVGSKAWEQAENPTDVSVLMLKKLRQIFLQLSERKGGLTRKYFDQHLRNMINIMGAISIKSKQFIQSNPAGLTSQVMKISKYSDQILYYILRTAPMDIQDEQGTMHMMQFLQQKLEVLLSLHNQHKDKTLRQLLQKNIKSLIYDLGLLQSAKPLILSWNLPKIYECLFYIVINHQQFVKNACVRYSLIGIKRIIKEFSYYADQPTFLQSIRSKQVSPNTLTLRQTCHQFYINSFTDNVITNLLNFLLQNPYAQSAYEGWAEGEEGVQRGQQKEASAEACVVMVVEALLQRFPKLTHQLIRSLINSCMQSGWSNIQIHTLHNLLSVVAILPSSCKKQSLLALKDFPVMQILEFIYKTQSVKLRFAPIVAGWMDHFDNQQISSLTTVLLSFMQQEGISQQGQVLVGCCQCINKLINRRLQAINLQEIVQRAVPILLNALGQIDNPDILWPIVTLISGVVSKTELQSDIIVHALEGDKLSQLVSHQSTLLVQALCDMFKAFLCIIPRNKPARSVYTVICTFLNQNLSRFDQPNHEKIFYLWYVTIREYSSVQQCDQLYVDIFESHFRKNLYRKTSTLIYILEEYMLAGLVPSQLDQFVSIIVDCYIQASSLQKEEGEKLKVASLSFQITLITQYDLQQVNSNSMLQLILADFCNFDTQKVSATIHNSILAIINRYLILYRDAFLAYLQTLPLDLPTFLDIYFQNMQFVTSRTAAKINTIAILSLINNIDHSLMIPKTHTFLQLVIPEVEHFQATLQSTGQKQFIGVVDNSPSLRFASNVLSQRKEQVRKRDGFESVNLVDLFRSELRLFLQRIGASFEQLSSSLQGNWGQRLLRLI